MIDKLRAEEQVPEVRGDVPPLSPLSYAEHLLKVACSVSQDANRAWADVWAELHRHVTPNGVVTPDAQQGFVPECGWPEFLEKLWLVKHYIDSIQRICNTQH